MSCDPCGECTKVSDISGCNGTLTIGEIANDTEVKVCVLDLTTGRIKTYIERSSGAGILTIDRAFAPDHYYRIWINTTNSLSVDLPFNVYTLATEDYTTEVDCAEFGALAVADGDEVDQTLSV